MNYLQRSLAIVLPVLLSTGTLATSLPAQADPFSGPGQSEARVPITLVASETGRPPMVLRRVGTEARNIILVDLRTTTAAQLSDAIFQLLIQHEEDPTGARERANEVSAVSGITGRPAYPWAAEGLRRLAAGQRRPEQGLGQRRTVRIWVRPVRRAQNQAR